MKKFLLAFLIMASFGFCSWVWLWDGNKMGLSPDSFVTDVPLIFLSAKTGGTDSTFVKSDSVKSPYVYVKICLWADSSIFNHIVLGATQIDGQWRADIHDSIEAHPQTKMSQAEIIDTLANGIGVHGASSSGLFQGGENNIVVGSTYSFIGAGFQDSVKSSADYSGIVGGQLLKTTADFVFMGGGSTNQVSGNYSGTLGGTNDTVSSTNSCVVGGRGNTVSNTDGVIAGGQNNKISNTYSFIGGGIANKIRYSGNAILAGNADSCGNNAQYSVALGGTGNFIDNIYGIINGNSNVIRSSSAGSGIIGGSSCIIGSGPEYSVIVAGLSDSITGNESDYSASLSGKSSSIIRATYGVILAGEQNSIKGNGNGSWGCVAGGSFDSLINYSPNCFVGGGTRLQANTSGRSYLFGGAWNKVAGSGNADEAQGILGGLRNYINTSINSAIYNGQYDTVGTGSDGSTIIGAYAGRIKTSSSLSFILGGNDQNLNGNHSGIIGGQYDSLQTGRASGIVFSNRTKVYGYTSFAIGSSNCIVRGESGDSCSGVIGIASVSDSNTASFVGNVALKKADSTFAWNKQIWVMNTTDTSKIRTTAVETDSVIDGVDKITTKMIHPQEAPTIVDWNATAYPSANGTAEISLGYIYNDGYGVMDFYCTMPIIAKQVGGTVVIDSLIAYIWIEDADNDANCDSIMLQSIDMSSSVTWATVKSWATGTNTPGYQAINFVTSGDYTVVDKNSYRIKCSNDSQADEGDFRLIGFKMVSHLE